MNFGKGMATKQRVEIVMAKLQEKAQAQVKQMVGQIIGDDELMQEGKEQQQKADPSEKQQSKAKERAQTIKKKPSEKAASQEQSRDAAGRKGPVLE